MRTHLLYAATIAALAAALPAQLYHTIPNGTATAAGNTSNAFPWGTAASTWGGLRLMAVYDSVNFTAASINTPIVISRLRWRVNDSTQSWTGGTFAAATVELSTSAVDWTAVTTNYATNHGADRTVVYSGPVTIAPGTSNGAGVLPPYVVDIVLQTPFLYDPNAGDLNIDVDYPGGTNFTGGAVGQMDVQSTGSNASRIYASSMYPAANGITQNHGPIVEIEYQLAVGYASFSTYGQGCGGGGAPGFYEVFDGAVNVNDLANGPGVTMQFVGNTYVVLGGANPIVTPVGNAIPFGDDQTQQLPLPFAFPHQTGVTNNLWVCSNGFIGLEATTSASFTENLTEFLSNPARVCVYWDDLNPAAGGTIHAEVDPGNPSLFHVTWTGVPEYSATGANTLQASFDAAGTIELKWGAMTALDGIVGYHPGNGASDPGGTDVSAIIASVLGDGTLPLALASQGGSRPVLGTTFNSEVSEIPAGSGLGAVIFGLNALVPPIDLSLLGATGCFQHTSLDSVNIVLPAGPTVTHGLAIPNNPAFAGLHVFEQAAMFAGLNPLGVITSNGGDLTIDMN